MRVSEPITVPVSSSCHDIAARMRGARIRGILARTDLQGQIVRADAGQEVESIIVSFP